MSKRLREMTVKEFREAFRCEYEELDKLHHEEFMRKVKEKKNTKYTLLSKLIENTSWGKAHSNITPKDTRGVRTGTQINLLFLLILIGIDIDIDFSNAKTICKYKNEYVGDLKFQDVYGSATVHRGLNDTFKHENNGIEEIVTKMSNIFFNNPEISVERFANEYSVLCENKTLDGTYLKNFTGNNPKDSYIKKLEEERNKMERTYDNIKKEIKKNIEAGVKQIILTGAPGTGKSRMAREIAEEFAKESDQKLVKKKAMLEGLKDNKRDYSSIEKEIGEIEKIIIEEDIEFVQFHPSYDYTDFVEGIRPVEEPEKDGVGFRKVNGIFKQFCQQVVEKNEEEKNEEKKYFFIIDEINRADLSKVFGELMYCLESDKRGEHNKITTQYQNMKTYESKIKKDEKGEVTNYKIELSVDDKFEAGFYIPGNVYIIGTMNDIDRSVESMDFALRRRFMWKEIEVNKNFLKETLEEMMDKHYSDMKKENMPDTKSLSAKLTEKIEKLNSVIKKESEYGLNKHYCISQGQFANLPKIELFNSQDIEVVSLEICRYVWDNRLKSLLFEYVRGEDNAEDFVAACATAFLRENNNE